MITNAGGNYEIARLQCDWKIIDNIGIYPTPSV